MAADVDGDGKITASDVGLMLDRLLGNLDEFPVELYLIPVSLTQLRRE
jgi:hypothetical protein